MTTRMSDFAALKGILMHLGRRANVDDVVEMQMRQINPLSGTLTRAPGGESSRRSGCYLSLFVQWNWCDERCDYNGNLPGQHVECVYLGDGKEKEWQSEGEINRSGNAFVSARVWWRGGSGKSRGSWLWESVGDVGGKFSLLKPTREAFQIY